MPVEGEREGEILVGKYRLEALLGSGATADVYRAENVTIGRMVAIKLLKREHVVNGSLRDRFAREGRAANLVRHPNVVDVLDVSTTEDGTPFVVQELLLGCDLHAHMTAKGGRLTLEETLAVLRPVVDAVAEAHARGVIHRDLKPENVFLATVSGKTVPKLLDFGISRIRHADVRATDVGVTMGTPAYMPPEQIEGLREADARSDVWALGVLLFELLTGRLPFEGKAVPAMFVEIATRDAPRLVDIDPSIPADVSRIVERCLRRSPEERYPSAAEIARDLEHLSEGTELEATEMRAKPPVPAEEPATKAKLTYVTPAEMTIRNAPAVAVSSEDRRLPYAATAPSEWNYAASAEQVAKAKATGPKGTVRMDIAPDPEAQAKFSPKQRTKRMDITHDPAVRAAFEAKPPVVAQQPLAPALAPAPSQRGRALLVFAISVGLALVVIAVYVLVRRR